MVDQNRHAVRALLAIPMEGQLGSGSVGRKKRERWLELLAGYRADEVSELLLVEVSDGICARHVAVLPIADDRKKSFVNERAVVSTNGTELERLEKQRQHNVTRFAQGPRRDTPFSAARISFPRCSDARINHSRLEQPLTHLLCHRLRDR